MTTLLGRPVHQLVNANIESANHVAITKCIKSCRQVKRISCFSDQMSECGRNDLRNDLSDFDRRMIVGARRGGLSISEIAALLGFSCKEVRARLVEDDRKVTVKQITTDYNSGMQSKSISEHVMLQSSKEIQQ